MSSKKKEALTIGLLLFVSIAWVGVGFLRKHQLQKSHRVTIAKAVGCSGGGLGNAGRLYLDYMMEVEGKKYKSSNAFLTN